jgi:hypothetical protein
MPLVQHLREDVLDWLNKNADDPRVSVHMKPLPNWPEFPNGKFWDSLRRVDPEDKRGFEEWMIDLRRQEKEYPACVQAYRVLRYACGRVLWDKQNALVDVPQSYRYFARIARKELGVISFNWDLVCERALKTELVCWGYSAHEAPIPVIKPHGSLNWTNHLMQRDWGRDIANPAGFRPIAPGSTISYMPNQPFDDPLLKDSPDNLRCLIFPGFDELLDHKAGSRASTEKLRLWNEAVSLIERADCVVFIGYSLPSYDSEARQTLEHACCSKVVHVCNPAIEVIEEFRRVFKQSEIVPEHFKFEESQFGRR